jgi:ribosomal protein S18 acetylase RimI-like enzyme
MMQPPRIYRDERDFNALSHLVAAGRAANLYTWYPHTGDVGYWYYYFYPEKDLRKNTFIWEDPKEPGRLLGWALLYSNWHAFDVYVQPELRETAEHAEMLAWAADRATKLARQLGRATVRTMWVSDEDTWLRQELTSLGIGTPSEGGYIMETSLKAPLPEPVLPDGFELCALTNKAWVETRARAQAAAFQVTLPFDRYLERYRSFRSSPVYDPELDLMTLSPDGRAASFCLCWVDPLNQVGLFEPVGTHPDFRRKGLGRAVMLEGMRRLKQRGMRTAVLGVDSDNPGAIKLYESAGFHISDRQWIYEKKLEAGIGD